MRTIIAGDQCEYAPYNPVTRKSVSACSKRHLAGSPPTQMVIVKWDSIERIFCIPHAKLLQRVETVSDLKMETIRKRKSKEDFQVPLL